MRNLRHFISKSTMVRKVGAKRIPEDRCERIYDRNVIGVRVRGIAKFYKMPQSTVACLIRRYKMQKRLSRNKDVQRSYQREEWEHFKTM